MQMTVASCMKVMRGWHGASAAPFGQHQVWSLHSPAVGSGDWALLVQGHVTGSQRSSLCRASDNSICLFLLSLGLSCSWPHRGAWQTVKIGMIENELKLEGSHSLLTAQDIFSKDYLSRVSRPRIYYIFPKFIHKRGSDVHLALLSSLSHYGPIFYAKRKYSQAAGSAVLWSPDFTE